MKNIKICSVIFLATLGWLFASNTFLTNLESRLGYINSSTGVMNFSHESSVMISHYQQLGDLISILLLVALFIFARRLLKDGVKIAGVLFVFIAIVGIILNALSFVLAPLNTIYIG